MKRIKTATAVITIFLFSTCHIFLENDPAGNPENILKSLWKDFNETYGPMGVREKNLDIKWDTALFNQYKEKIDPKWESANRHFFELCGNMLMVLRDSHVGLHSQRYNFISYGTGNFDFEQVKNHLINNGTFAGDGYFLYGTFKTKPRIGYIQIRSFDHGDSDINLRVAEWANDINGIMYALESADVIVIDVRGNRGGFDSNMEYIAGHFFSVKENYIVSKTKNGTGRNDFSNPVVSAINPSTSKRYTKPIVLLTNRLTSSAAEWFTLALRTQEHVTHVGTPTNGILSTYIVRPLINGWHYTISVQMIEDTNGICYEGIGVTPYILVEENQLEEAITLAAELAIQTR